MEEMTKCAAGLGFVREARLGIRGRGLRQPPVCPGYFRPLRAVLVASSCGGQWNVENHQISRATYELAVHQRLSLSFENFFLDEYIFPILAKWKVCPHVHLWSAYLRFAMEHRTGELLELYEAVLASFPTNCGLDMQKQTETGLVLNPSP